MTIKTIKTATLFLLLLLSGGFALAQSGGGCYAGQVIAPPQPLGLGQPVPGAIVRVCSSTATGSICSPLTPGGIFSDPGLTDPISNPLTADQNGNYNFCASQGSYLVQAFPDTATIYSFQITVGIAPSGSYTFSGNNTFTGTNQFSGIELSNTLCTGALSGFSVLCATSAGPEVSINGGGFLFMPTIAGDIGGTPSSPTITSTHITGGTVNTIPKFNASGNIVPSACTDNASTVACTEPISSTGGISGTTGIFSSGVSSTTGAFSSNVTVGGTLGVTGAATTQNLNNIQTVNSSTTGADICAKIATGIALLPAGGGTVDARFFQGTQSCSSNPFASVTVPVDVIFGAVTVQSSVQWVIAADKVSVFGSGMNQTILQYTGGSVASFIKIATATPTVTFIQQITWRDLTIKGSANVTDTLFLSGVHHSTFENLSLRDCTGAALHTQFAVVNTYKNIHVSSSEGSFVRQPANGLLFDHIDTSHSTTASTVIDPIIEGVSGSGIKLTGASGMTFTSGTSENNTSRGIEITSAADNFHNTFINTDLESNTTEDILDNGIQSLFINTLATNLVHIGASAAGSRHLKGQYNSITIDAGSTFATFDGTTYNNQATGTLTDNGADSNFIKLVDVVFPTVLGHPWSYRDTVPAQLMTGIGTPDKQDMLAGSFTFTTTPVILSNNVLSASTPWRILFIGAWVNNTEGGALPQLATLTEVTSAAPTLTVGSLTLTISQNVSNQLQGVTGANNIGFTGRIFILAGNIAAADTSSASFKGSVDATSVPGVFDHSGTQQTKAHIVQDTCTLGTSCAVTLTGAAVFTSSTSYTCNAQDQTAAAATKAAQSSGSAVTFTGTGTDVLRYTCIGN